MHKRMYEHKLQWHRKPQTLSALSSKPFMLPGKVLANKKFC